MIFLAIQTGHNATVGLYENGRVTSLLSQEKIDNVKNSAAFPSQAIEAMLHERHLSPAHVDHVVIASKTIFPQHCAVGEQKEAAIDHLAQPLLVRLAKELERGAVGRAFPLPFKIARTRHHGAMQREAETLLRQRLGELGLGDKPISFIDHHLCHARAAYHALETKPGEPALIFTLDGMGDGLSASITRVGADGSWEKIAETDTHTSLGTIYSETTRFLGMKPMEHEYKVMGLSAYCKGYHMATYRKIFEPVIDLDPANPLSFKAAFDTSYFYDYLIHNAVGERFDNIAGAVQNLLEDRVTRWIAAAINKTGIRRIFTGGGVFMNVKLNMKIQEMPEIEQAFFLPSCGDESNPLGALYALAIERGQDVRPLENLYLGIGYDRATLKDFIDAKGLDKRCNVSEPEDIDATIASLLADRDVVARFSGRCEWGARSLGNRAILAHPSYMESFYTVNDLIKARDFWMPFAPSVLDSAAPRYLENYHPAKARAPHMITAFKATDCGVKDLRAAMHQGDWTIRPQVVEAHVNPDYYRLIHLFEEKTGVGAVMNTSFNLHGYPLVATPEQALMTFENSGLAHLALGPFLISKKEK